MGERSKLWLLSAALLAAGGLFQGYGVWLVWRPCAGMMLEGSIFRGYRYSGGFTPECGVVMDTAPIFPTPYPGEG